MKENDLPRARHGLEDTGDLDELEADVRQALGDEEIDLRLKAAEEAIVPCVGTGDLPPDYDPESDPLVQRRRAVARKIVLITIAGVGGVAAAKGIQHYRQNKNED